MAQKHGCSDPAKFPETHWNQFWSFDHSSNLPKLFQSTLLSSWLCGSKYSHYLPSDAFLSPCTKPTTKTYRRSFTAAFFSYRRLKIKQWFLFCITRKWTARSVYQNVLPTFYLEFYVYNPTIGIQNGLYSFWLGILNSVFLHNIGRSFTTVNLI